jgi:hypothetical protein
MLFFPKDLFNLMNERVKKANMLNVNFYVSMNLR